MQSMIKEKVNVSAIFRAFKDSSEHSPAGWDHKRIEPFSIKRKSGEILEVEEIRRSYSVRKGNNTLVHFVFRSTDGRYFHMVFESEKMIWILLYEFEESLLFDDVDVDVQINWRNY